MGILKSLKKETIKTKKHIEVKKLIVGDDFHTLHYLSAFGDQETRLVVLKKIEKESIVGKSFQRVRGAENIERCRQIFPNASIENEALRPTFYKENKFRHFGGRSKSEKLLLNEEFYTQDSVDFNLYEAFPFLNDSSFWERYAESFQQNQLKSIDFIADENKWSVEFFNGDLFKVENLVWGLPPWKFLKLVENKALFENNFIEYCESTKGSYCLTVKFQLSEPLSNQKETFFIPLSLTHDWGHFIGEFYKYNHYFLELVNYFDPDDVNEEGISKRIKLLKRSLEKIYPQFAGTIQKEFISVNENIPQFGFESKFCTKSMLPGLSFIGESAPLPEGEGTSHFLRGVLSCKQFAKDSVAGDIHN